MKEDPVIVAKKLLKDSTPGPWSWRINENIKVVDLITGGQIDNKVMIFERWGVASGTPAFKLPDIKFLRKAFAFSKKLENGWSTIDHPDANLIAQAPELIRALMEEVLLLRAAATKRALDAMEVLSDAKANATE